MGAYITRRLLWTLLLLWVVSGITFIVFNVLPSADPALLRAGRRAEPEIVQNIRETFGLDKPLYEQYWNYMKDVFFHFDFGRSYRNDVNVRDQLLDRLPNTLLLIAGAVVVWLAIGLTVGMISAVKRGTILDRFSMTLALICISAPVYWLGLVVLYLFSDDIGRFPLLPGSGSFSLATNPLEKAESLLMPWFVLATAFAAIYARLFRANLLEVMGEDYIRTARAKGLSERRVIFRHGARSALTPIVTVLGLDIGILVGGAILTESVFNIPGIGRLTFDAIQRGDIITVQGATLFLALGGLPLQPARRRPLLRSRPAGETVMSEPLLSVRDLKVHFNTDDGRVKAVDGVSYDIGAGRTLGIVGESGSGKSVSSLTVMGLTRSKTSDISGEIRFGGADLLQASDAEMRAIRGEEIAMIFQDPLSSLHPFYRIGDQLVEAVQAHHDVSKAAALDKAIELLRLVGIPQPKDRVGGYPHEFSGGMRQRVMIAMALINEPKLLIADEPTTALDVTVQAQILELMIRLKAELNTSIVFITHDLGVVAEMADDIAVMYAGRIVEFGPKEAIFESPAAPVHVGPAGLDPEARRLARRAAGASQRAPAVADQPARRVLVPPALPVRARGAQDGRADARAGRRRLPTTRSPACSTQGVRRADLGGPAARASAPKRRAPT